MHTGHALLKVQKCVVCLIQVVLHVISILIVRVWQLLIIDNQGWRKKQNILNGHNAAAGRLIPGMRWKYPSIYPSTYPSEIFPSNICFWRRCHCQISWERKRMKRIKEDYPCHPLSVRPSNFLLMTFRKRLSEIFILLQQPLEIQCQEQHVSCFWRFWRFSRFVVVVVAIVVVDVVVVVIV